MSVYLYCTVSQHHHHNSLPFTITITRKEKKNFTPPSPATAAAASKVFPDWITTATTVLTHHIGRSSSVFRDCFLGNRVFFVPRESSLLHLQSRLILVNSFTLPTFYRCIIFIFLYSRSLLFSALLLYTGIPDADIFALHHHARNHGARYERTQVTRNFP